MPARLAGKNVKMSQGHTVSASAAQPTLFLHREEEPWRIPSTSVCTECL